ncbi:MAG: lamin tail domain-containing protein [Spirochaetes bacterium]|nr:lamin tail domain-containing protein [Spirochaetota bacterium]
MKLKLFLWALFLISFVLIWDIFPLQGQTIMVISNRKNTVSLQKGFILQDNFVICAFSNGSVNTNITARIYLSTERKSSSGAFTINSTTTFIESEFSWEEEGSERASGHTLLVRGKCVLESFYDMASGDIRLNVSDARQTDHPMKGTNLKITITEYSSPQVNKIIINEVNYDTGYVWEKEWVEFYNNSSAGINMNNYFLTALPDKHNRITPANTLPAATTTIPPCGYLVLVANLDFFTNFFSWVTPGTGDYTNVVIVEKNDPAKSFRLSSPPTSGFYNHTYLSGDSMILFDSSTNIIERLDYKHDWKTDENDISIERKDPAFDAQSGNNWGGCIDGKGSTPGKMNSIVKTDVTLDFNQIKYIEISKKTFNPKKENATIYYKISNPSSVKINIYNSEGYLVKTILSDSLSAGNYTISLTGQDDSGNFLPSGIYLAYLEIEDQATHKRINAAKSFVIGYW